MFLLDKEIARQPAELKRLLAAPSEIALDPKLPIRFVGIGTSLHACRVAEEWMRRLTEDGADVRAEEAHRYAIHGEISERTQVVVVSHRGTKKFTNQTLERARRAGARTIAITADSEVQPEADSVLRTCSPESASTHTVSYLSSLAVLGRLIINTLGAQAAQLREALQSVPAQVEETLGFELPESLVSDVADRDRLLVAGYGIDRITADEAALKLKEGTYKWAESLTTELALHGPPAAYGETVAAIVIRPAEDDAGRTDTLCRALADLKVPHAAAGEKDTIRLAKSSVLTRPFVSILPVHKLVSAVARRVGANPDTIHTDLEPWKSTMLGLEL